MSYFSQSSFETQFSNFSQLKVSIAFCMSYTCSLVLPPLSIPFSHVCLCPSEISGGMQPHVPRKSGLEEEANMLIKVHLRRIEGDPEAAQDTLPSATVHAHPSMTLDALRRKISTFCPVRFSSSTSLRSLSWGSSKENFGTESVFTLCLSA